MAEQENVSKAIEGLEVIQEDIKDIEQDIKKINCNPICELIRHTIKCIIDCITYFCGSKTRV